MPKSKRTKTTKTLPLPEPHDTRGRRRKQTRPAAAIPTANTQDNQAPLPTPATPAASSLPPQQNENSAQNTGMVEFMPPIIQPSYSCSTIPTISPNLPTPSPIPPVPASSMVVANAHQPTPPLQNSVMFPIGHHVDQSTKQKIICGQFVNLPQLLVRDPTNAQPTSTLTMDSQGNIVSQPKQLAKIGSIERWTDAFLIYASIFLAAHPHRLQQLFKYLHDIRLGAQKSNGWVIYDEQFRLRMAHNPSQDWGIVDNELWVKYMTPTIDRPTPSSPNRCFDFNFKGVCSRAQCAYSHRCLKCNGKHSSLSCLSNANQSQPSTTSNNSFRAPTPGDQHQFRTPDRSPSQNFNPGPGHQTWPRKPFNSQKRLGNW